MLWIEMKEKDSGVLYSTSCHVGAGRLYEIVDSIDEVLLVQADGHELDKITSTITGLPRCIGNRVERWHGDFAKFIVDNLEM